MKAAVVYSTLTGNTRKVAKPKSAHAFKCAYAAKTYYGEDCKEIGSWHCQGAIDPKLIERMRQMPKVPGNPHAATPETEARWAVAASHPDTEDLAAATEAAKAVRQIVTGEDPYAELKAKLKAEGKM